MLSTIANPTAPVLIPAIIPPAAIGAIAAGATTTPANNVSVAPIQVQLQNQGSSGFNAFLLLGNTGTNGGNASLSQIVDGGNTDAFLIFNTTPSNRFDPVSVVTIVPVTFTPLASQTQTASPSSTTTPIAPTIQTPTVSLVLITSTATGGANSTVVFVVVGSPNLSSLSTTGDANTGNDAAGIHVATHTGQVLVDSGTSAVSILMALPTSGVRPPQSLDLHPEIDRDAPLRLHDDEDPFAPVDDPHPGDAYQFVGHDRSEQLLDFLAIAGRVEELGRVPAADALVEHPALVPADVPLMTDLNAREETPTIDPLLTGLVVTLGGSLAMRPDRSGVGRRGRLPWPPPASAPRPTR